MTVRMIATITVEYDAEIEHYYDPPAKEPTPDEMATIDMDNASPWDVLDWGEPSLNIEPAP